MISSLLATQQTQLQQVQPQSRAFERRALIPVKHNVLWEIRSGVVRTVTWMEDGNAMTLGIWGPGDVVGEPLCTASPLQIECLVKTEARIVPAEDWSQLTQALILHSQRSNQLIEILHSSHVEVGLLRLLEWLGQRFGRDVVAGRLLDFRLTHQELAELLGSSRVTITRLINNFEEQGLLQRVGQQLLLRQEKLPCWHYEI